MMGRVKRRRRRRGITTRGIRAEVCSEDRRGRRRGEGKSGWVKEERGGEGEGEDVAQLAER